MASLADKLDELSALHFAEMTMVKVRPVATDMMDAGGSDAVIKGELDKLEPYQVDVLMKAVYVCLANDCKNSAVYFKWHAALHDRGGPGSIVRTLTDKPPKQPPVV